MISTHPADHADPVPVSDIPRLPDEYVEAAVEWEWDWPDVVDVRNVWVRTEDGPWEDYDDAALERTNAER